MQIGFNLPISGPMAAPDVMANIAQLGETLGFDYLTLTDHIALPVRLTDEMAPGSVKGLQLVVTDIDAARAELAGRGMDVSEVDVQPWGSFVYFSDPDGNSWAVQYIPPRPS